LDKTIRAKKALGQHFLTDPVYCRRIVDFAALQATDLVIEIGPGTGRLTQFLLDRAARVLGIEFDPALVEHLKGALAPYLQTGQFQLLEQDVLEVDWDQPPLPSSLARDPFSRTGPTVKVIGNLPYNIATRIIRRTCESSVGFQTATFMTQKEVAERILAEPGNRDYGYLTLVVDYRYRRRRGFDVPPGAFRPRPKVVSHVFQLEPRLETADSSEFRDFDRIVQWSFSHRRKTLWNNLLPRIRAADRLTEALRQAGIDPRVRPEAVTLEQFLCLSRVLSLAP
jgi:16S rRNA (adenine1518-N6/adenine1519-N6)-dimethyltransferase